MLNTNMKTSGKSSVFNVMEAESLKFIAAGFNIPADKVDGIMNADGTVSSMSALLLGRHYHFPHVRDEGWQASDNPVCLVTLQCYEKTKRTAMMLGLATNSIVKIPVKPDTGKVDSAAFYF